MRTRERLEEIADERAIHAAWLALRNLRDEDLERAILLLTKHERHAVRKWVETKYRGTLLAIRGKLAAPERGQE